MTLTSKTLAILIVVLLFGGIFFSDTLGWWQTKNSRLSGRSGGNQNAQPLNTPRLQEQPGQSAQPGQSGEHAGSADGVIRGRTTFGELLQWGLTQAQIETVLGVPMPSDSGILIRDFCTEKGLSFGNVKAGLQVELGR
mgnify:CR=1 FL=1